METGHIGRQASAAVMVTDGETVRYQWLQILYIYFVLFLGVCFYAFMLTGVDEPLVMPLLGVALIGMQICLKYAVQ